MKGPFTHASETFRLLNPHLFGGVGAVETRQPQPQKRPALDRVPSPREDRETGVVLRVVFTAHLARPMDDDNLVASLKPLRDAVAASLGVDDGDPRVEWACRQVKDADEGVSIKFCQ